ncbi:MAG: UDP-N-acetylmuramoyl-L-alanyl-D-glutamate--2,6-diaminopimelate ligase [Sandaracinaceae bacterium]|nr:UDP-N-acetylmuramoyl-L-alanyl-D-glutamate--2,6-diaminopimelate ligase [Sandaracinaceae bacterium]
MTRLAALCGPGLADAVWGDPDVEVRGVRHDSREVEPGDLFVAIPGRTTDGARFVAAALARGAVAVAAEERLAIDAPQLHVADARRSLGALAAVVYGDPTRALAVVGVTGTNGKTTTTWLLDEALRALGARPALLGTIESRGPGVREPAPYTTPEGDAIARFARAVLDAGATHLAMEVSSHALAQHRADAVAFRVAAFTNLTQDHLDFHETMEAYFAAKARLFVELAPQAAVVALDDPYGARLAAEHRAGELVRVSREGRADAEVRVIEAALGRDGIRARIAVRGAEVELVSPLLGGHNLDNLLTALGCLVALGYAPAAAADALGAARGAPGRLERVDGLAGVAVLVDYAHTPDALARALDALAPITPGRRIVVFGCGGDRDAAKRPRMGEAAASRADVALVTSDNPRTEDPHAILAAIEPAVAARLPAADLARAARGYEVIEDRALAIRRALSVARPGDTVLIAGKGHEDYQIRGTTKHHFDDREEARAAIRELGGAP